MIAQLSPLQRTSLDRIVELAAKQRDHNQRLSYTERADMDWIVKYAQYLQETLRKIETP